MVIDLDLKTVFLVLGDVYEFIPKSKRKSFLACYEYEGEGFPVFLLPLKSLNTLESLPVINQGRRENNLFLVRVKKSKIYLITTSDPSMLGVYKEVGAPEMGTRSDITVFRAFYSDSLTDAKEKLGWQIKRSSS